MNIVSFYLEFNVFDKRLTQQKHNFKGMIRDSWKKQAWLAIDILTIKIDISYGMSFLTEFSIARKPQMDSIFPFKEKN